jgi:hypothetical protein
MIEFLKSGDATDRQAAMEIAADAAREMREVGLTTKSVKEIVKSMMDTAEKKLAKQRHYAKKFEEADRARQEMDRAREQEQREAEVAEAHRRADANVALPNAIWDDQRMMRLGMDFVQARTSGDRDGQRAALVDAVAMAQRIAVELGIEVNITPQQVLQNFLPAGQAENHNLDGPVEPGSEHARALDEAVALPDAIWDDQHFQRYGLAFVQARARGDKSLQRKVLTKATGVAQQIARTLGIEGSISPQDVLRNLLPADQWEDHGLNEAPAIASGNVRPNIPDTMRRRDVEERDDEDDDNRSYADAEVDVTMNHVRQTQWSFISDLYDLPPDEADELEAIASTMVKKGEDNASVLQSSKDLLSRAKKKKKKGKFRNARHLMAAVLDAIKRKAMKKKVTKPLKPSDIPDDKDDQKAA